MPLELARQRQPSEGDLDQAGLGTNSGWGCARLPGCVRTPADGAGGGWREDFLPVFDPLLAWEPVSARRKFWWFGLCAAIALGVISASDARGLRRYLRLQHELETLSNRKHQLMEQNRQLREEIQALREDPESIERAVREELGFIRPGEVVFNME